MKPKDVRDEGISERGLRNVKQKIRQGKGLKNISKIARIQIKAFKSKGEKFPSSVLGLPGLKLWHASLPRYSVRSLTPS